MSGWVEWQTDVEVLKALTVSFARRLRAADANQGSEGELFNNGGCEQICTVCSGRLPSRPLSGLVDLDYLHWQNDLLGKIVEWVFQTVPLPPPLLGSVGGNFWESRISRSMLQKHLSTKETELGNESYPAHQRKRKRHGSRWARSCW